MVRIETFQVEREPTCRAPKFYLRAPMAQGLAQLARLLATTCREVGVHVSGTAQRNALHEIIQRNLAGLLGHPRALSLGLYAQRAMRARTLRSVPRCRASRRRASTIASKAAGADGDGMGVGTAPLADRLSRITLVSPGAS